MELLPLLIFLGGIVYSLIASQKDKGKKEKRDIDPGKLGNPSKTNRRQPGSNKQDSSKGFFEQMKNEIERSFGAPDDSSDEQRRQQTPASRKTENSGQRPERSSQQRPQYQRAERTSSSRPATNRSFGRSFEEKAGDSVFTEGFNRSEAEKRVGGIGRESAELARYSLDDDDLSQSSGKSHEVQKEKHAPALDKGDFSFDRKAVLNGIIFSEILGKPRSKR